MNSAILAAHNFHSVYNRVEIMESEKCGCFYCLSTFPPSEIEEWADIGDDTAICPKCSVDSVIGDASGYPIETEFLKEMHDYWFDTEVENEDH